MQVRTATVVHFDRTFSSAPIWIIRNAALSMELMRVTGCRNRLWLCIVGGYLEIRVDYE
jgi:hypothetical protein